MFFSGRGGVVRVEVGSSLELFESTLNPKPYHPEKPQGAALREAINLSLWQLCCRIGTNSSEIPGILSQRVPGIVMGEISPNHDYNIETLYSTM